MKDETSKPCSPAGFLFALLLALTSSAGCSEDALSTIDIVADGRPDLAVVYATSSGAGVKEAAEHLVSTFNTMTGLRFPAARAISPGTDAESFAEGNILLLGGGLLTDEPVDDDLQGQLVSEGYVIRGQELGDRRIAQVAAPDDVGLQYGAYDLLRRNGVRYFHPADTLIPQLVDGVLQLGPGELERPGFALRGFHHHTQHPIPMSVYLLEPATTNLVPVRQYLQWLVRNRQNVLEWHMLKTVDMATWVPYVQQIRDMARPYGVKLGIYLSFADQQQNNYRLITDTTRPRAEQDKQIKSGLDTFLKAGFELIGLQFGTSEFTKVTDAVALGWLDTAALHLSARSIPCYAWVHTAGDVKADDGKSYFYHLPERANAAMGGFVHTTMFYDMVNPAPVYANKDFHHQRAFLERNLGKRKLVYFPETAWWLGFDINLPLALPITGHSRGLDILQVLKDRTIEGHVTFTSGMEWGYWRYDHYLTRVTWDRKTTWAQYLDDFSMTFGSAATTVSDVLRKWTDLQVRDFYGSQPELFFYLAGELPLDEVASSFGIVARQPKRAFKEILDLKSTALDTWKTKELDRLAAMLVDYKKQLVRLEATLAASSSTLAQKLYLELRTVLELYVHRIEHTHLLYDAVRLARIGREDGGVGASSDAATRAKARADATARVAAAKAITQKVIAAVGTIEKSVYRHPASIVSTKRTSLTLYQFGYLWETHAAYFWSRRDEQAENLLQRAFGQVKEEWGSPTPALVFRAKAADIEVTQPDHILVKQVLSPFIPGFMVAVPDKAVADGTTAKAWSFALDQNANDKPDAETVVAAETGKVDKNQYVGTLALFKLPVVDKGGNEIGVLGLQQVTVTLALTRTGTTLDGIASGKLDGTVVLDNFITVAMKLGGIDREGLLALMGAVLGFDPKAPPPGFPISISFKKLDRLF